jgi:glycosyltransferase involved in cell wall biosynthesis
MAHIVHVLPNYHPVPLTGADRYLSRIAEHLAENGVRSTIVTPNVPSARGWYVPTATSDRLPTNDTVNGVSVQRLSPCFPLTAAAHLMSRFLPHRESVTARTASTLTERIRAYATGPLFTELFTRCRALRPTAIHAGPFPLTHVLTAAAVAQRLGIPFVLTPVFHFELPSYYNPIYTSILARADLVIALTQFERTELITRFNLEPSRIVVVPFGLDTRLVDHLTIKPGRFRREHGIPPTQRVVLYAGSKGADKGATDVLAVVSALNRDDVTLIAIGMPTPDWNAALAEGRPRHLVDLGYIDEAEKWAAFRDCDVVAVPMRANAFGLVFLEGWYFGKPVIGGLVGAASEIVQEGVNGHLVTFGDRIALKERLLALIDHPAQARALGAAGKKRLAAYTDTAMTHAVTAAFVSLV